MKRGVVLALALAMSAAPVRAEESKGSVGDYTLDLAPPDLSAFALLGINPNQVTRPGTVRELSAAVLNGVRSDGTLTPGIAIEWSPITTWTPNDLEDYAENVGWRRITISAATAADGTATRAAVGARWVIVDDADPLSNSVLHQQLADALVLGELGDSPMRQKFLAGIKRRLAAAPRLKARVDELVPLFSLIPAQQQEDGTPATECAKARDTAVSTQGSAEATAKSADDAAKAGRGTKADRDAADRAAKSSLEAREDEQLLCQLALEHAALKLQLNEEDRTKRESATKRIAEIKKAMREKVWNATTAQIGLGFVSRSDDSRWKTLEAERFRAYGNFAMGAGSVAQIVIQADVTKEFVEDEDVALGIGGRAVLGSPDVRGTGEIYGQIPDNGPKLFVFSAGGELKLAQNVWLEFQVGAQKGGEVAGPAAIVTRANIKYGSSPKQ